jgi:hypothetical protein
MLAGLALLYGDCGKPELHLLLDGKSQQKRWGQDNLAVPARSILEACRLDLDAMSAQVVFPCEVRDLVRKSVMSSIDDVNLQYLKEINLMTGL